MPPLIRCSAVPAPTPMFPCSSCSSYLPFQGSELLHLLGLETAGLEPPLTSVPWILFNNVGKHLYCFVYCSCSCSYFCHDPAPCPRSMCLLISPLRSMTLKDYSAQSTWLLPTSALNREEVERVRMGQTYATIILYNSLWMGRLQFSEAF